MSGFSGRGLSGNRLYIAIFAWFALVVVGVTCLYVGYKSSPGGADDKQADPTSPSGAIVPSTTQPTAEAQPTSLPVATPVEGQVEEEVFGYGIAAHAIGGDPDYWMKLISKDLGLKWVKQQVRWRTFEGNPNQMDWSGFDRVVEYAAKHNLKVMLSVVDAPLWTRSSSLDDNPEGAPPEDLSLYAEFLGNMVDRYQGRIHAIEVWNEQNLDREWDTKEGVNAARYVEMLGLAHQAIKSRDPNIIVVSGALSPLGGTWTDKDNPNRITAHPSAGSEPPMVSGRLRPRYHGDLMDPHGRTSPRSARRGDSGRPWIHEGAPHSLPQRKKGHRPHRTPWR